MKDKNISDKQKLLEIIYDNDLKYESQDSLIDKNLFPNESVQEIGSDMRKSLDQNKLIPHS